MNKCPYCREEIENTDIKCRKCGELLEDKKSDSFSGDSDYVRNLREHFRSMPIDQLEAFEETYNEDEYTPDAHVVILEEFSKRDIRHERKVTQVSEEDKISYRGIVDATYSFRLEDAEIKVEHTDEGYVQVFQGENPIYLSKKPQTEPVTLNHLNHEIYIQYLQYKPLVFLVKWSFGFRILLDGKSIEGTVDDPRQRIKIASFGVFFYAFLLGILIPKAEDIETIIGVVAILVPILVLGLLARKAPRFCLTTGLIFGLFEFIIYLIDIIGTQHTTAGLFGIALGTVTRMGALLAISHGILAAFRSKILRHSSAEGLTRIST